MKRHNESESAKTKNSWVNTYATGASITALNKNDNIIEKLD